MIFRSADAAGLGVFQGARQAGRALVIGTNVDQNSVAPGLVPDGSPADSRRGSASPGIRVRHGNGRRPIHDPPHPAPSRQSPGASSLRQRAYQHGVGELAVPVSWRISSLTP